MKVYNYMDYEYWYDRSYRTWYAIKLDSNGFQVGEALFAFSKREIVKYIELEYK